MSKYWINFVIGEMKTGNENQKAVTGSYCAHCMGCVHVCPYGGMLVNGHKIKKEKRYRRPGVEMKDLFLR